MTVVTPAVPATTVPAPNNTGQWVNVDVLTGTITMIAIAPPSAIPLVSPAVPATTVTAANVNAFPALVVITANGATITAVTVNGTGVGTAAGSYVVPPSGTISISYTVATPIWAWSG